MLAGLSIQVVMVKFTVLLLLLLASQIHCYEDAMEIANMIMTITAYNPTWTTNMTRGADYRRENNICPIQL
jgi:hypothetical protein